MKSRTGNPVHRLILIGLIALALSAPSFGALETLPAQLSDSAFWKLITDSSEPDGVFFSENLLSNERGFQYVIPALLERAQPGSVYVGVGPEQNFTYIAALHPRIAFVVDIRRQNMVELFLYKAVFEMSPTRGEFLSHLFSRRLPAGLAADSDVKKLFEAMTAAPLDEAFFSENLRAVEDLLIRKHGFALTPEDIKGLEHVYSQFARQGTSVGYSISNPELMSTINMRAMEGRPGVNSIVSVPLTATEVIDLPILQFQPQVTLVAPPNPAPQILLSFPNYTDLMTATDGAGNNWSYLANETNYQSIREMQQQNRIVPLVGDFAGPHALRSVGKYLRANDAAVAVFYLSNVEQYLNPAAMKQFYENIATMPLTPSSTFIRSAQGSGAQPGIVQSSISPIREVMDAVLAGRIQKQADILKDWH